MCLGALVDAGVDLHEIRQGLKGLPVKDYRLASGKVFKNGIAATKVDVVLTRKRASAVTWKNIKTVIDVSTLDGTIKKKGLSVFKRLFEAEARVHGESFETVHLHELGGVDCVVDIFGTLIGLEALGVREIFVSPVNLGSGVVKTVHGVLPVPAPATAELLKGYPVYASDVPFELTTPTGAAILAGLKAGPPPHLPHMLIERIGYGAGNKEIPAMPNTLRLCIGEKATCRPRPESTGDVVIIETNIDDMNPQIYEDVMDKLFEAGALDVFLENIIMKRSRPAVKLTVIADEGRVESLSAILFKETTTIGIRSYRAGRTILEREIRKIKTKYGDIRIKISRLGSDIVNISPEYTDLKALSKKTGLPVKKISEEIAPALRLI